MVETTITGCSAEDNSNKPQLKVREMSKYKSARGISPTVHEITVG